MTTLLAQMAQMRIDAILEIFVLLLVAGIIGYLSAMFYTKSVYKKKMMNIIAARDQANQRVITLETEMKEITLNSGRKDTTIGEILEELRLLKGSHIKARYEIADLTERNQKLEIILEEKDDSYEHIAARKHFLSYGNFGTATPAEKDDLKMISGISPNVEKCLNALDIFTFRQISRFTRKDIEDINNLIDFVSGRIEKDDWIAQAIELDQNRETKEAILRQIKESKLKLSVNRIEATKQSSSQDLTAISGIGGWIKEKLNALGIYAFHQISNFTEDDIKTVTEAIQYFPGRIERDDWIQQAKELDKDAHWQSNLLKHMEHQKDYRTYNWLGTTHKRNANNLTLINGIGLWLEERLNKIGIYTFVQLSQLKKDEINKITKLLEINADKIENDKWVKQAIELGKKQLSAVSA